MRHPEEWKKWSQWTLLFFLTHIMNEPYTWAKIADGKSKGVSDISNAPSTQPIPEATGRAQKNTECTNTCDQYFQGRDAMAENACPTPSPVPSGQPESVIEVGGVVYTSRSDCLTRIKAELGADQLGPFCHALKLIDESKKFQIASTVIYGASAITCWSACIAEKTGVGAVLDVACTGADIAATIVDLGFTIKLSVDGQNSTETLNEGLKFDIPTIMAGTAGAVVGGATVATRGTLKTAWNATKEGAKNLAAGAKAKFGGGGAASKAENVAREAGGEVVEKGAKEATEEVGQQTLGGAAKKAAEKGVREGAESGGRKAADKAGSCISAAILTATTAVKIIQLVSKFPELETQNCNKIKELKSYAGGEIRSIPGASTLSAGTSGPITSSSKGRGADMAVAVPMSIFGGLPVDSTTGQIDPNKVVAMASQDPLVQNLGEKLPPLLGNQNLAELTKQLEKGNAASAILATNPDFANSPIGNALANMEKMINEGRITAEIPGSVMTSGGGGGGANAKGKGSAFPFQFNTRSPTGKSAASEIKFDQGKPTLNADGDIYHSRWTGTIFEIVSLRLENSKPKIDSLEWASPLNRALLGLPPLKPGHSEKGGFK